MFSIIMILIIGALLLVLTTAAFQAGLCIEYPGAPGKTISPSAIAGKRIQSVVLTVTACPAGNAWEKVATVNTTTAQANGQTALVPNKNYALAWVSAYSANGVGIRFKHSSWGSVQPGGPLGVTISQRKNLLDFAKIGTGQLPVFNSSNALDVYVYATTTDTAVITVGLVPLD